MVQSKPKFATFEEYLAHANDVELEGCYEFVNGELIELPPESEPNNFIANRLQFMLVAAKLIPLRLAKLNACELQVPIIRSKDPANRFPDLVIFREEHLELTQQRLTITIDMPPPQLVVEVVSPGQTNRERDYVHKRDQYAARGIPEYWIINPEDQTVMVLALRDSAYVEVGIFQGNTPIISPAFPELVLTPEQIFRA